MKTKLIIMILSTLFALDAAAHTDRDHIVVISDIHLLSPELMTPGSAIEKADAGAFKKSILIVDDDAQYLTMVREWLKDSYKVMMANSGMQAIKWLGKNKADLILLDHEMPVTSGPQVLEMLRSDPETSSIPVMFLTGKGDKESVMAVVALKPEGYFLKNISRQELLEKLKEFFILHK